MNPELIELEPLDDRPGPARPISHARAQELVRGALKRVIAGEGTLATEGKRPLVSQSRQSRIPRMTRAAIIVAGFLIVGGAVAALSSALWSSSDSGARDERPRAPGASAAPESRVEPPAPAAEATPAPAAENTPPTMATAEANAPGALNQPPHSGWRKPVAPPRPRALVRPAAPAAAPKLDRTDKAPEAAAPAAEDALSFANHMRGERRWQEAAAAYQKVIGTFPGSDAAYVATLARAELLLDHLGKPGEALQLFQRTLTRKPSGLLTEEARYGIAACYRAMGDRENERRALGLFLATQPHSLLRSSVEARLAELR